MTEYLISDLHLYPQWVEHPGRELFHSFLEKLAEEEPGRLWILGDLFDYWFEYRTVMPSGFTSTLCLLQKLKGRGWKTVFIPGNHDWWCGRLLEEASGMEIVRKDCCRITIQGLKCLFSHGDGMGKGDTGYRLMKPLLRSSVSTFLFYCLHPDTAAFIAGLFSNTSKRILRKRVDTIPACLARWAQERKKEGIDLVVTGHTHCPAVTEMEGLIHASTGDWITHFTYLTISEGQIKLNEYKA
ncbi:hypothetical protein CSA37_03700 [Candidatus Fermentibacteria bacterium]|nr:MAG: hypothetical protein CSA37_03700 [Candidatus Fermentibacteria bacterium]